ncbi:PREDICTED: protein KBP homolog isoform X2 [Dinoponera quadriceps]|uniref:KIF-binding protein n=1 Tax=Dinoponera quadriceps TaxID=609295 RepID=A0A6P3WNL0_DINQU|nr:PREDICTED: protein KBP homolog isoform X2 [Dinoponera quadriceps]
MNSEPVKNIEIAENITMNCTEKLVQICCNLKLLEDVVSGNEAEFSTNQTSQILSLEELINQSFYELTNSKNPNLDDIVVLAQSFIIMYYIKFPKNTSEREHLYIAEGCLVQSVTLLKDKELDSKAILVAMVTFNELSHLHTTLGDIEKSLQYLNKALELYMAYTKGQDDFPAPINILNIIGIEVKSNTIYLLDKKYMDTLRSLIMLEDKVKHGLIDMEKISTYMHNLLKKQLKNIPKTIDHISWAKEVIRLAEYFLSCDRFMECKNHLITASVIMIKHYNNYYKINMEISSKNKHFLHFQYKSIIYIIDTCWVRYGLTLLYSSRKHILNQEEKEKFSMANSSKAEFPAESINQSTKLLMYNYIEKEYKEFVHIVKDNYIRNYNDAKMIFVNILQLLNKMQTNEYTSKDAAVRAEIAQYVSKAYKYFAFYERDKIDQIKLQKRRIEILEDCLKTLHTRNDQTICSFIWFELAIINSTVLGIKIENLHKDKPAAEELAEIDQLVKNSTTYFELYNKNSEAVKYGLANGLVDQSYQIISILNIKHSSKRSIIH